MNYKEITDLIKLVNRTDLAEVKLKDKDFEISIRTANFQGKSTQVVQSAPAQMMQAVAPSAPAVSATPAATSASAVSAPAADSTEGLVEVKSPIVGTFYRSSAPDKPVYAKVGDVIEKGSTVCVVEAMKLFNEIECEVSGTIVKVMVEDAAPVEYDQVLFLVDPS